MPRRFHSRRKLRRNRLSTVVGRGFKLAIAAIGLVLVSWLLIQLMTLRAAAARPVDAFFVLGGSIRREIHVAEISDQFPETPILISTGSVEPCIWLIFDRAEALMQNVWLENCADSTFGNFFFSTPILEQWDVHHIRLVTSPTHVPRALWMARILLGSHGIWVEPDLVEEQGIPGNEESWLKTSLDLGRSMVWAIAGQFYHPNCSQVKRLVDVDMAQWQQQGFKCERQGNL